MNNKTKAADLSIGDEMVHLQYPSFGGKIQINKTGTVTKLLKTRVVLERTVSDGAVYEVRLVVDKYGDITGLEGDSRSYGHGIYVAATDPRVEDAERRNAATETKGQIKKLVDEFGTMSAQWITAEKTEVLIAKLIDLSANLPDSED